MELTDNSADGIIVEKNQIENEGYDYDNCIEDFDLMPDKMVECKIDFDDNLSMIPRQLST